MKNMEGKVIESRQQAEEVIIACEIAYTASTFDIVIDEKINPFVAGRDKISGKSGEKVNPRIVQLSKHVRQMYGVKAIIVKVQHEIKMIIDDNFIIRYDVQSSNVIKSLVTVKAIK